MRIFVIPLLLIPFAPSFAANDSQWSICPSPSVFDLPDEPLPQYSSDKDMTHITSDIMKGEVDRFAEFEGNVVVERHRMRVNAQRALHDAEQNLLTVQGDVHFSSDDMALFGSEGRLRIDEDVSEFDDARYVIYGSHIQGSASYIQSLARQETLLTRSSLSTCEPDNESWKLRASRLRLDYEDESGSGRNVVLWFGPVPIFYTPYIEFPIGDRRRSGLLMPTVNESGSRGWELAVPYYWNIAPNQDAVITPRYMEKRGVQLGLNYRYLTRSSRGDLDVEYLENDRMRQEDRYSIDFANTTRLAPGLTLGIDGSDVSDSDYFTDLVGGVSQTSVTHLQQRIDLNYRLGRWNFSAMAQNYVTVDESIAESSYPYRRLPQLRVRGSDQLTDSGLQYELDMEWVEFDHASETRIAGSRATAHPRLSWVLGGSAWFFTPAVSLYHSQYDMEQSGESLDIEQQNIPVYSLDTGLFFERQLADGALIQTLEPRLFYLNAPYRDQSDIPLFDTGEPEFSFAQLFRENRFTGPDRVGDADQLTIALTSRLLGRQTGEEFLNFGLGQILYFEDREVALNNQPREQKESDVVGELAARWGDWTGSLALQWNPERSEIDKQNLYVHYQADNNHIFNIGYRYRRDPRALDQPEELRNDLKQSDLSWRWRIHPNYYLMARWNYDLTERQDLETLAGIEYDACCWAMRVVTQRSLKPEDEEGNREYDNSIKFQLIFKGLGSVAGKRTKAMLERAILGFQPDY